MDDNAVMWLIMLGILAGFIWLVIAFFKPFLIIMGVILLVSFIATLFDKKK